MAKEFKLPDPGEGIHEAEVVELMVSIGDEVEEGQIVIVIETDKAANELPSPFSGAVEKILVSVGDMIRVGDVMMLIGGKGEAEPEVETEEKKLKDREKPKEEAAPAGERKGTPIPAAPSTRRIARELNVDLRDVPPSGPGGRVMTGDVQKFAESRERKAKAPEEKARPVRGKAPAGLPDFSQWGPVERQPLRTIRRATAKRMQQSWSEIPHVSHFDKADITELERLRRERRDEIRAIGGSLTLTIFLIKAAAAALKKYPRFNSSLDMENEEIIIKRHYHVGVAVDTDQGLLVPVIRDADCKSLTELAVEFKELAERTRAGEADLADMSGGTFTITNVGPLGGTGFTPIINYPQAAILGAAKAELVPVVRGDEDDWKVEPRLIMPLILTFDHRLLDGADSAAFLGFIIKALEDPAELLLMV